jgi:N-methylhydantoinase A
VSGISVAFDTGGTFTDFVLQDERGEIRIWKRLSTPDAPSEAVVAGLSESGTDDLSGVALMLGSTTLVSNCVLERKGASTALVATAGHADLLEIGREIRYDLYDLLIDRPQPLVPRRWVFEAAERIDATGAALVPLDPASVEAIADAIGTSPIRSVAVCLLHAYRQPAHERALGEALAARHPNLCVSLSSEVAPEIREYERASTTVINAYVQPVIQGYVSGLREVFGGKRFGGSFLMMASHGGLVDSRTAERFPVRLLESGPAAGALAAAHVARETGRRRVLSFDMGGTTAKLCLVIDGRPALGREAEVAQVYRFKRGSGLPVKQPMLEMIEIGAGGGSIAAINHLGLLQVGPESAGAQPGPACYALGGETPTVTDADLVLGYLHTDYFLGGRMKLDGARAVQALRERVARPGDLTLERAAWGVHDLVNENMAAAARVHIVEQGRDPRDFDLVAFGGAGPVHAYGVATRLGVTRIVVPPLAGVFSSLGLLVAPLSVDLSRSYPMTLGARGWDDVEAVFEAMRHDGLALLAEAGVGADSVTAHRRVDMRYAGQGFEIPVEIGPEVRSWKMLADAFSAGYRSLFGRTMQGVEVEAVTWRLGLAGPVRAVGLPRWTGRGPATKGDRAIWVPERGRIRVPVYDRYALGPGTRFEGPAIIEEAESTVVAWGPCAISVDERLSLTLELPEGRA